MVITLGVSLRTQLYSGHHFSPLGKFSSEVQQLPEIRLRL